MRLARQIALVLLMVICTDAIASREPRFPIQRFTLANGLRVILSVDHSAPVIGLALAYDVGSRNEVRGRTGFAHLFEHLMFEGSAHVPKGALDRYIEGSGGLENAFTRDEDTTYIESFPSEKLPLILWIEGDRMRALNVSAEAFKNQQEVVKEEKRLRYDNQPYSNAEVKLQELAYTNFADAHPVIGSMADLDAASLEDVRRFFHTYYVPNNATLVLVGDMEMARTRALIERYFGDIPRAPAPPTPDLSEPPQSAERRAVVDDPLARLPAVNMAWHGPNYANPDHFAMDLLADILFNGETSRAYQQLVKGKQLAVPVNGSMDTMRGPSLFTVSAIYRPTVQPRDMEQAIYGLVEEIEQKPPSAEELERVKTRFRGLRYRGVDPIFSLESMLGRAIQIADAAVFEHNPNAVNTEVARYMAVTPEQIQAVARKYFTPQNRTVVEVRLVKQQPAQGQGGAAK